LIIFHPPSVHPVKGGEIFGYPAYCCREVHFRRRKLMKKRLSFLHVILALSISLFLCASPVMAQETELSGTWYGTWQSGQFFWETSIFRINISGSYGTIYLPELGLFNNNMLSVTVDGNNITFSYPGYLEITGIVNGDSLSGSYIAPFPFPPYYDVVSWQAVKYLNNDIVPNDGPGPGCYNLPSLYCMGSAEYCSELVPFEPEIDIAYINYPQMYESWENQFRSYLGRDLMLLIKYASSKLQCKTEGWDFGNFAPLGLGDMSEADGSIPGTSIGMPGHPPGTHLNGRDIDVAYYQLYSPDNLLRAVCDHYENFMEANHCTGEPYTLDVWRTALFVSFLAEHPRLRVIGVDGKVGPVLEDALDELVLAGWIDANLRDNIPLKYEETDGGLGWYLNHHHHIHISMHPIQPILLSVDILPDTLNLSSSGQYITGYIELIEGYDVTQIDIDSVSITVNDFTVIYAEPEISEVADYNNNAIPDLMVKFDRQAVQEIINTELTEITVTGSINGKFFQGSDMIRFIE
jgi:hypothetical protein